MMASTNCRPINPDAKWIQQHREWAKNKEALVESCFQHLVCIYQAPSPIFCQVDIAASRRQFATRFPDAALTITTHREMEVRQIQFPALEVVQSASY